MTTIETKIYIFGGGDSYQYLNDLHILDTGMKQIFKNLI